jgi:oxalate decarboxylase
MAANQSRASKHKINLRDSKPVFANEHGSIQQFTTSELPLLKNLSLQTITLAPAAILEPKWFANCNTLAYVISGKTIVRTLDSASDMSCFTVTEGQMFHVHSGALFTVENISDNSQADLLFCNRHETPKGFSLSASAAAFTDAVIGNTWDVDASHFTSRNASMASASSTSAPRTIVKRTGPAQVPDHADWPHPNRFDIEEMQAPTNAPGIGSAKKARAQYWKILTNIAMYSLRIEDEGMREPHWHPDTVELGYIKEGKARMSIMDPDGSVDTFILTPGDVYFIPASYPHQIEVIGDKDIHFLIFFDQPMPKDVGFRQAGTVMSRRVMAAAFGIKEEDLPEFPYDNEDPLLVKKRNPEDPIVAKL